MASQGVERLALRADRSRGGAPSLRRRDVSLPAAVEKALKAFLVWHDAPFAKTHDLGKLGNQAVGIDASLENLVESIVELSKYAWMFRYPGDPISPTPAEAAETLARATTVVTELAIRTVGSSSSN